MGAAQETAHDGEAGQHFDTPRACDKGVTRPERTFAGVGSLLLSDRTGGTLNCFALLSALSKLSREVSALICQSGCCPCTIE